MPIKNQKNLLKLILKYTKTEGVKNTLYSLSLSLKKKLIDKKSAEDNIPYFSISF